MKWGNLDVDYIGLSGVFFQKAMVHLELKSSEYELRMNPASICIYLPVKRHQLKIGIYCWPFPVLFRSFYFQVFSSPNPPPGNSQTDKCDWLSDYPGNDWTDTSSWPKSLFSFYLMLCVVLWFVWSVWLLGFVACNGKRCAWERGCTVQHSDYRHFFV